MSTEASDSIAVTELVRDLLAWMATARRDLPWRRRRDPYAVWVSEVMLQQTQVTTVVPYFERWLARFPDVAALAAAPEDEVLKAWEGLGYYSRARNLHAAARIVAGRYGGALPAERGALLALPGIGRYTAGAILSLAFGQAEPVLDGNVRRVLCRVYDVAADPRQPAVERELWQLAQALVAAAPPGHAGDLNEALMELGALVCVPGQPDCLRCPLQSGCLARRHGVQAQRPTHAPRAATPHYDAVAALIVDVAGRCLLARRPSSGLLGGLWELPGERNPNESGGSGAGPLPERLARALRDRLGIEVAVAEPVATPVKHAFTHFRITLHPFRTAITAGAPQLMWYDAVAWVRPTDLHIYALPVTDRRILHEIYGQL